MDSTKKKSTKRSPIESSQEEVAPTVATTKPKKTKSTTTTKKKSSSEKSTAAATTSSQQDTMETESEVETTTPSSQSTTTSTSTSTHINTTTTNVPTTPISRYIPSLSQMGTPLSPNRAAQRLREKDELHNITNKLKTCLKKLESAEVEIEKKTVEIEELEQNHIDRINKLQNRTEELERQLSGELITKSDLISQIDTIEYELKTKEATWKKDREEMLSKLTETMNKLTQEHSIAISHLKSDLVSKDYEMDSLRNEIARLKDDLLFRVRDGEEKSRKLLDNEYTRMKQKEEEFNQILQQKDDEIRKIKLDLKEKEKSSNAMNKKENELNQLIQAHERQIEDMRDSINREWEVKAAQMMEEHHSRTIHLEQTVESFSDERDRFKSQIEIYNGQIEDLNIKNNELEDKVKELNDLLVQKDTIIKELGGEIEDHKKKLRKQSADLKSKDSQISLLQVEMNTRENKCGSYQSEINRLKSEIYSINSQMDPEIPLTHEIENLNKLVNGFEKTVSDRKKKKRRLTYELQQAANYESPEAINTSTSSNNNNNNNNTSTTSITTTTEVNGDSSTLPNGPEQLETFNPNTITISTVDSAQEFIKLSVHGDYDEGLSFSKWKLIVVRPDGFKAGFAFPEGIQPVRGIKSVTVWTGRTRPQNTPTTENEFYWSRGELWTNPIEGTIVKLVSPNEVTTSVTLPASGIYQKEENTNNKSNCLIM